MSLSSRALCRLLIGLAGLMAAAGLLVSLLPFEVVRTRLDALSGDGSADLYTENIHRRFRTSAAVLGAVSLAVGVGLLRHRSRCIVTLDRGRQRLAADARRLTRQTVALARDLWVWLVLSLLLACAVRIPYLDEPMRYDEAHTFVKYASQPALLIVTRYDEPNNHILHSLCVRAATLVFGDDPWAIRLPALVCGILLAPLTLMWGTVTGGRVAGITAGLLIAVHSNMVELSVNARGYTLASVLFALACLCGGYALRRDNLVAWIGSVAALALSLWTVPTMLYGAVTIFVWLGIDSFSRRNQAAHRQRLFGLFSAFVATCALTALCYLPVLLTVGLREFLGTGEGATLAAGQFIAEHPDAILRVAGWMMRDVPYWVQGSLGIGAILALALSRRNRRRRCWQAVAAAASVVVILWIQRVHPPERIWCFAVAPILILAASGLSSMTRLAESHWHKRRLGESLGLLLVLASAVTLLSNLSIRTSTQTGAFREAADLVEVLKNYATRREPVIAVAPASAPLVYYASRQGLSEEHFQPPGQGRTDDRTGLVVTSVAFEQTPHSVLKQLQLEMLFDPETAVLLLATPTAEIHRVQRQSASPSN